MCFCFLLPFGFDGPDNSDVFGRPGLFSPFPLGFHGKEVLVRQICGGVLQVVKATLMGEYVRVSHYLMYTTLNTCSTSVLAQQNPKPDSLRSIEHTHMSAATERILRAFLQAAGRREIGEEVSFRELSHRHVSRQASKAFPIGTQVRAKTLD